MYLLSLLPPYFPEARNHVRFDIFFIPLGALALSAWSFPFFFSVSSRKSGESGTFPFQATVELFARIDYIVVFSGVQSQVLL
jgi:hypothetical protein